MDSSYTNPYGAQPSIPSGGQDPNAWPPVSDPSASPAQPQYAAPAEPVAIEPAQPQYATPVEPAQPQYVAPEPYQPATYQQPQYSQFGDSYANEQGDIVLSTGATTKKLTPKRILILAGVALAVVLLFAVAILNVVGGNKTGKSTSDVPKVISDNAPCVRELEKNEQSAEDRKTSNRYFLTNYYYQTTEECVNNLTNAKQDFQALGSWTSQDVSQEDYEWFKENIISFINAKEDMLPVYKDFFDAYQTDNETILQKYIIASSSDPKEQLLSIAASELANFITEKQYAANAAAVLGCSILQNYGESDTCYDSVSYYKNDVISSFNNGVMLAAYIEQAFEGIVDPDRSLQEIVSNMVQEEENV